MSSQPKIKISDETKIRSEIDSIYSKTSQKIASEWAMLLSKHVLQMIDAKYQTISEVLHGYEMLKLWQLDKCTVPDVRKAALAIHRVARESESDINRTVLRSIAHAVASGHMKEHAIVASDYAIKAIGLLNKNNVAAITKEREWQLAKLKIMVK